MPDEMSKDEQAAFASMQEETSAPPEPAPVGQEPPEPESAEPPEGEAIEAPAEGDEQPKPAGRVETVPFHALNEERKIRQQLEAENRRLAEDRARVDERLRIIEEMNRPRPQPVEKPDRNVDPIGTINYLEDKLERLEQAWQQNSQQWTEQQQQQAQIAQLDAATSYEVDQYKARVPDYNEALHYWRKTRADEMQAYGMHPARIEAELIKEGRQLAAGAFQRGVSPAQTVYDIARARGYVPGNGRANNGRDGAAEQIQRVATGQQRNQTLSGTGGGATPTAMTGERLARMSEDEFYAWAAANGAARDRLLGKESKRGRG